MGAQATVDTIVTTIKNCTETVTRQVARANTSANCEMSYDTIEFEKSTISPFSCQVTIKNECYAVSEAEIEATVEQVVNFVNNLNQEQKSGAAAILTASFNVKTNVSNITNTVKTIMEQECVANANVVSKMTVKNLKLPACVPPKNGNTPIFEFHNIGNAKANCIVKLILSVAASFVNDVTQKQESGVDYAKLIWPITIAIICVAIVGVIATLIQSNILTAQDRIDLELAKHNSFAANLKTLKRL
jgi:hypothetical protein